jgi:Fe-S cluster assembly iron-binding protein IscA
VLTITETAADALETIVDSIPDAPDTTGLRIAHGIGSDGQPGLTLELAPEPGPDDQVVDGQNVPVFLEPELAEELDDKVLDAQAQGDRFAFTLAEQP